MDRDAPIRTNGRVSVGLGLLECSRGYGYAIGVYVRVSDGLESTVRREFRSVLGSGRKCGMPTWDSPNLEPNPNPTVNPQC